MEKKNKILLFALVLVFLIYGVYNVHAQTSNSVNVCCEKTTSGAWCQNAPESSCDQSYRKTPTSCESTSFCKPGCCIDTDEGICSQNTPQRVCEGSTGTWVDDSQCNVVQCSLGCCILGDQASLVTLTRCKKLAAEFGLNTNFRADVTNEVSCIAIANGQDKGACVYESENIKTCKIGTRAECDGISTNKNVTGKGTFFKDYLCSSDELGTNCGPTTESICVGGKDEVYFKDTCGNPANIYDSNKIYSKNPSYWQKIIPKAQSCNFNDANGNANSKSCGNCEYFKGSICGKGSANYGSNICKDLNCYNTANGKDFKNGESWCVDQGKVGNGADSVGSRHYKHICINGEETTEACADFRNEYCFENKIKTNEGDFIEAACRANRWQDCVDQKNKDDCINTDKRDCYWQKGVSAVEGATVQTNTGAIRTNTQTTSQGSIAGFKLGGEGSCLPTIPPGSKFWEGSDSATMCSIANSYCEVVYEKGLIGGKKCIKNCECLSSNWASSINNACTSLGDCGAYVNVVGKFTDKGAEWKINGQKRVIDGLLAKVKAKAGL